MITLSLCFERILPKTQNTNLVLNWLKKAFLKPVLDDITIYLSKSSMLSRKFRSILVPGILLIHKIQKTGVFLLYGRHNSLSKL